MFTFILAIVVILLFVFVADIVLFIIVAILYSMFLTIKEKFNKRKCDKCE